MTMQNHRDIVWTAITCHLDGADIFLGLAAGLDDIVAYRYSTAQMTAFPMRHIRVASTDSSQMPLRVYAVRDPSIVRVEQLGESAVEEGFLKVRISFRPDDWPSRSGKGSAVEAGATAGDFKPPASVMAFLLTIGLPEEKEPEFYDRIVTDFLDKSWVTLPRLLHKIGCMTPESVADGECKACS